MVLSLVAGHRRPSGCTHAVEDGREAGGVRRPVDLAQQVALGELGPRELPVAVVGNDEVVAGVAAVAAPLGEDALDLVGVDSRAAAIARIEDREVYAAIVPGQAGTELLLAPAASPTVASMLREAFTRDASTPPTVTEVVPLPAEDPRGVVFAASALPLVLGGIVAGAAFALRVRGRAPALTGALSGAALSGLALAGVLQGWLGALAGSYLVNSGVIALGIAAIALTLLGLHRLLGFAGLGLGALTMLLLGNPLSGVTSAPELLPLGWLGQLLPPGATGSALRSTAFFDGAGAAVPLLVLGAWALGGLALALLPGRRRARVTGEEAAADPVHAFAG